MWRRRAGLIGAMGLAWCPAVAQKSLAPATPEMEKPGSPVSDSIRRKAGLSPETPKGNIEILEDGVPAYSLMSSIVASRTPEGWRVSYACAESAICTPDRSADHRGLDYMLSPDAGTKLDTMLDTLAHQTDPGSRGPDPLMACPKLDISIDLPGLQRKFHGLCAWGPTLGAIKRILSPASAL